MVTGDDIIAKARTYIGKTFWNGEDGNPPHVSAFYCEAFGEFVPRTLGLTEARIDTAADAGRAHKLSTSWPPANGAWVFLDERFYAKAGHMGFWDAMQGQLLCTLTVPTPNGTIGYMSISPQTVGLLGWCFADGAQASASTRAFAETGHSISGPIKSYWERFGTDEHSILTSIDVFGLPITDLTTEAIPASGGTTEVPVQYFERAVLEDHGANGVMGRRLGAAAAKASGHSGPGIS